MPAHPYIRPLQALRRLATTPLLARGLGGALALTMVAAGLLGAASAFRSAEARAARAPIDMAPPALRLPSPADMALQDPPPSAQLPPRDRLVALANINTGESATFNIGPGGYVRSDQTAALERFLRCRRTDRRSPIDPGVLVLLADIAEHWPGRVVQVLSGFRAPPFGVPHSRHFIGHAIDLRVLGVPTTAVRDYVWREHHSVGVGYYPQNDFIHVDSRTRDQEIAWSARQESADYEYHPLWSRVAKSAGQAGNL